jgi:hypothetical protein
MSTGSSARVTLAEVCKTPRLRLEDLARASGVSLNAIKQLEQNPPNKDVTWGRDWRARIAAWIPLLGHAFPAALESKALAKCPHLVLASLRQDYANWASSEQLARDPVQASNIETRRNQLLAEAQTSAYQHDWETVEKIAARATRLFAKNDPRWLFHKAFEASCRVYKGDLDGADVLVGNAIVEHDLAAANAGQQPDPQSVAHAQLVRAWSSFNRGHWQTAQVNFEQAIRVGQLARDTELLNTGLHMCARIALERSNLETAFGFAKRSTTPPSVYAQRLQDLEAAQVLVSPGCVEDAYGTWFIGVVTSVSGDLIAGRRLLERSAHLLRDNGLAVESFRKSQISLIHNALRFSAWDAVTYKTIEHKLRDMLPQLEHDRSPYANALAMLTLVHARLLRDTRPVTPNERRETADWLCLALLAHPYTEHLLWQIGMGLLRKKLMPSLSLRQRITYAKAMPDRLVHRDPPFDYLDAWGCNTALLPIAMSQISSVFDETS